MREYDRTPYQNYMKVQAARVEASIDRLIRERPVRQAAEQRRIHLQNHTRLAELEQRRNAFGGEEDV